MSPRHYQHPLSHYPEIYGVSYRTILRWAEKSYPLDNEAATRELVASQKNGPGDKSAPRESTDGARTLPSAELGAHGLAAAIGRLQAAEAEAYVEYQAAKAAGDGSQVARAKAWLALSEQLRKVEQSTPEVEQANKTTLRLDELQAELGGLFVRLRQDLDTLPQRIALELLGKDEIAVRAVLAREAQDIISALYSCRYLGDGAENEAD